MSAFEFPSAGAGGKIPLSRIENGTDGYIVKMVGGVPTWVVDDGSTPGGGSGGEEGPIPFYAASFTSSFTGSDENPLSENAVWSAVSGWAATARRLNNKMSGASSNNWQTMYEQLSDDGIFTDTEVILTIATWDSTDQAIECATRVTANGSTSDTVTLSNWSGYLFRTTSLAEVVIERVDNGSGTQLELGTYSEWATGDQVAFLSVGNRHSIWHKPSGGTWVEVLFAVDTTHDEGRVQIGAFGTVMEYDDFRIGGINPTTPTPPPATFPNFATTVTSDFTGADQNPLTDGGNWAAISGWAATGRRLSNALVGAAASLWALLWKPTQQEGIYSTVEVIIEVTVLDGTNGIFEGRTRVNPETGITLATHDGYLFRITAAGGWRIFRVDNNSETAISGGAVTSTLAANDLIGFRSQGSKHEMWKKRGAGAWTLICSGEDTTYETGRVIVGGSHNVQTYDNFRIGGITITPTPSTTFGVQIAVGWPRMARSVGGSQFYVSTTGNNGNPGTLASPWATVQHAFNSVPATGSVINCRGGTYNQGEISWSRIGNIDNPVTLQSFPGETAVLNGGRILVWNAAGNACGLRIRDLELSNGTDGVKVEYGHHIEIEKCYIHGQTNMGILLFGSDLQVWDCHIHDVGDGSPQYQDHGAYTADCVRVVIANCLIYDIQNGFGIQLYPAIQDSLITGCSMDDFFDGGPFVLGGDIGSNVRIVGCIGRDSDDSSNGPYPMVMPFGGTTGCIVSDCVAFQTASPAFPPAGGITYVNCVTSDPLYTNVATRDYTLQGGSPAIDLVPAAREGYLPALDIDGTPRVTADAGCYAKT